MSRELWLRLDAPFAAFRWMQAGVWRGTSPTIPPSAAWGLILNLAGIETRDAEPGVTTQIRADAPQLELAVGVSEDPERSTLYQQLHSYPVGNSGKELEQRAHGQKYWIAPVRREFLVGFRAVLGVRGDETILSRVRSGLRGELDSKRYGLPFAGDNNLLFDQIEVLAVAPQARWYERIQNDAGQRKGSCRLTISIDRSDSSKTTTALFAPMPDTGVPSNASWVTVPQ